jgi:hypothetical protein
MVKRRSKRGGLTLPGPMLDIFGREGGTETLQCLALVKNVLHLTTDGHDSDPRAIRTQPGSSVEHRGRVAPWMENSVGRGCTAVGMKKSSL